VDDQQLEDCFASKWRYKNVRIVMIYIIEINKIYLEYIEAIQHLYNLSGYTTMIKVRLGREGGLMNKWHNRLHQWDCLLSLSLDQSQGKIVPVASNTVLNIQSSYIHKLLT